MRFRLLVLLVASLVIAVALPVVAESGGVGDGKVAPTTSLIVKVRYKTPTGKAPLAGVEVFAFIDGQPHYACTNGMGKAVFGGLGSSAHVGALITGPSVQLGCPNTEFLNPDTGASMYTEFYLGHHGVPIFDTIDLPVDGSRTVTMVVYTARKESRICNGLRTTPGHIGTNMADVIIGTPGDDVINARGGDDEVYAGKGRDTICGGRGNDLLFGQGGDDSIFGGAGNDRLNGGTGTNWLHGDRGTDKCLNGAEVDSCEK